VLVWARAGDVPGLYLAFAGIGLAGAAVQYEPAFATINAWFDAQRQKALLTITMVAGLASTIFLPASALLISRLGWRQALLILAAVQAVTAVPHVLLLRLRPSDYGWQRDGIRDPSGSAAAPAARSAPARVRPDVTEGRELSATLRSGPVALLTAGAV
jgi:MFS family permease